MKSIKKLIWEFERESYKYIHQFLICDDGIGHYASVLENNLELKDPEILYKFYGNSDNDFKSLSESYLYFQEPKNFNDPFDCLANREKQIFKIADDKNRLEEHRDNLGVCCFSLNHKNPLMWGHYSNKFKGYCLKFNNMLLHNNNEFTLKSHVSYLKNYSYENNYLESFYNQLNEISFNEIEENSIKNMLLMHSEYCWKYYDWKYEQEYRLVSINSTNFNREYKYDKTFLEEIYIGYRMKIDCPDFFNSIVSTLKSEYPNIKIYEVSPHHLFVDLKFNLIDINKL